MNSEESRKPLVNQVISDKVVIAENIGTLNMGDTVLLPTPNQLPPDIKFFSGRTNEINELKQVLSKEKSIIAVCSVWGMGGIGKSALAIHVANEMYHEGHFQDGVLFANLGEMTVDDALAIFIQAFNYNENQISETHQGKVNSYRSILRDKRVLVFLDNVKNEEQVFPFLLDEPTVSIIATSRKHLLALTEYSAFIKDLDVFSPAEARELLKKRVGSRYDTESLAVSKICELAGYLPLAISLAASGLADQNKWPILQKYVERLEKSDNLLDTISGSNPKARGLRRVFEVSYESLSDDQKKTIVLLTLFGKNNFGSSGLVALTGKKKDDAIDQLDEFVNLSLLLRSDLGGYRFHDLLQIFTEEKILDFSKLEVNIARSRLESYLIQLKQARKLGAQASLSAKRGNLINAIELYLNAEKINQELRSRSGQASALGGLASAYAEKGFWNEAIEANAEALIINQELGDLFAQAHTLGGLAAGYSQKFDWQKVVKYQEDALEISERLNDIKGQEKAIGGIAFAYSKLNKHDLSIEFQNKALVLNKKINNPRGEAKAYGALAGTYMKIGNIGQAIEYYLQAQKLNEINKDAKGSARALGGLATIYFRQQDWKQAILYLEKVLVLNRKIKDRFLHRTLYQLAVAYKETNEINTANKLINEAYLLTNGKDSSINKLYNELINK